MTEKWIQTYKGHKFDVFSPDPNMIDIDDIAHSLSMQCRFNGHCKQFYSVAQHSLLVAYHCHPENKLAALLHDAAEAYLCDIPKPIKPFLENYSEIEDWLQYLIYQKFGVLHHDEITEADQRMCVTEGRELMFDVSIWHTHANIKPYFEHCGIITMNQSESEQSFLNEFYRLTNEI